MLAVQEVAPTARSVMAPAPQVVQAVAPLVGLYLPFVHCAHAVKRASALLCFLLVGDNNERTCVQGLGR